MKHYRIVEVPSATPPPKPRFRDLPVWTGVRFKHDMHIYFRMHLGFGLIRSDATGSTDETEGHIQALLDRTDYEIVEWTREEVKK